MCNVSRIPASSMLYKEILWGNLYVWAFYTTSKVCPANTYFASVLRLWLILSPSERRPIDNCKNGLGRLQKGRGTPGVSFHFNYEEYTLHPLIQKCDKNYTFIEIS